MHQRVSVLLLLLLMVMMMMMIMMMKTPQAPLYPVVLQLQCWLVRKGRVLVGGAA